MTKVVSFPYLHRQEECLSFPRQTGWWVAQKHSLRRRFHPLLPTMPGSGVTHKLGVIQPTRVQAQVFSDSWLCCPVSRSSTGCQTIQQRLREQRGVWWSQDVPEMSSEATKGPPVFTWQWNIPQFHMPASKQSYSSRQGRKLFQFLAAASKTKSFPSGELYHDVPLK